MPVFESSLVVLGQPFLTSRIIQHGETTTFINAHATAPETDKGSNTGASWLWMHDGFQLPQSGQVRAIRVVD